MNHAQNKNTENSGNNLRNVVRKEGDIELIIDDFKLKPGEYFTMEIPSGINPLHKSFPCTQTLVFKYGESFKLGDTVSLKNKMVIWEINEEGSLKYRNDIEATLVLVISHFDDAEEQKERMTVEEIMEDFDGGNIWCSHELTMTIFKALSLLNSDEYDDVSSNVRFHAVNKDIAGFYFNPEDACNHLIILNEDVLDKEDNGLSTILHEIGHFINRDRMNVNQTIEENDAMEERSDAFAREHIIN